MLARLLRSSGSRLLSLLAIIVCVATYGFNPTSSSILACGPLGALRISPICAGASIPSVWRTRWNATAGGFSRDDDTRNRPVGYGGAWVRKLIPFASHPALTTTSLKSSAYCASSASPLYMVTAIIVPENLDRAERMVAFSAGDKRLGLSFSSILTRANLSLSATSLNRAASLRASAASFCAAAMSFLNASASLRAPRASDSASAAASLALPDSSLALSASSDADFALSIAPSALATAISDFRYASSALSFKEPINLPDIWLVRTRHNNSSDRAKIKVMVDSFANRFLRSSISLVSMLVKSAMYSPPQASATNPSETYSLISQKDNLLARDATSDGVRLILDHKRKENRVLICILLLLVSILVMKIIVFMRPSPSAPPLPTQQPSRPHPRADLLPQRPSQESCGECDES